MQSSRKREIEKAAGSLEAKVSVLDDATKLRKLTAFEQLDALIAAYESLGWSPYEEIAVLIDTVRNSRSDSARLQAIRILQSRRRELLESSGLLVRAVETREDGPGRKTVFSAQVVKTALNFDRDNGEQVDGDKRQEDAEEKTKELPAAPQGQGPGEGAEETSRPREAGTGRGDGGTVASDGGTGDHGGTESTSSRDGTAEGGGRGVAEKLGVIKRPLGTILPGIANRSADADTTAGGPGADDGRGL